ncbi:epsin [Trypanosoma theileri]|uniref:Epsin n=1 Tax=Trypanosoma theileri TaxID=67003 RepID=A0A1X0P4K8_9TRYP|nr:epsin [Trypanosoma theileri]ORC91805.1 epsin [Trypanosoma theileri]
MSIPTSLHAAKELLRVKTSGNEYVELVHVATNEDPWGPTGTQMEDVCRAFARGSVDIMEEIKLRLKHRDKSWRSCYKTLLLLDYLARNVPESGLPAVCTVLPTVRLISQTFYYTGSKGTDHGLSVRERAKKLCELLSDGAMLREEREKAALTRSKLAGSASAEGGYASTRYQGFSRSSPPPPSSYSYDRPSYQARTREEQERYDMELAARMQREEESRAGISVVEAERMYNQQSRGQSSTVTQAAYNSDLELARRLEEEEQQRRATHNKESSTPAQNAPTTQTSKTPTANTTTTTTEAPPPKAEPPKPDVLDDLFAPAPTPAPVNSNPQQPSWSSSAPVQQTQTQAAVDPFDAFLDTRLQQQQQQQQQQNMFGAFQTAPTAQPQQLGTAPTGMWYGTPQVPQQQSTQGQIGGWSSGAPMQQPYGAMPQQGYWGAPPGNGGQFPPAGAPQAPFTAGGNNFQGYAPFTNAPTMATTNNTSNSVNPMEQQMAQFSGHFGGQGQYSAKSLDSLMAERRAGQ